MKIEEFNLSKKIIFGGLRNGENNDDHAVIQRRYVKEFIELIKEKDFIMRILAEDVTIDEEGEMKFIDIEGVRSKINKLAGDKLT